MASEKGFAQAMAVFFSAFPHRQPKGSPQEMSLVLAVWKKFFEKISDQALMDAVGRICTTYTELPFGANHIGLILEIGGHELNETLGDIFELCISAVQKFGRTREEEALQWVAEKSQIAAAVLRRYGFRGLCDMETKDLGIAKGQMRAIYEEEREREKKTGVVVPSAQMLSTIDSKVQGLIDKITERRALPNAKT